MATLGRDFRAETERVIRRVWGGAAAVLHRPAQWPWFDVVLALALGGLLYGVAELAGQWTAPHRAVIEIDLSPWALPEYVLYSLARGLLAYLISLAFALGYGYWAAHDRQAARVLVPVLDILQSIPVLAFLPGLLLGLDAAFPANNMGLELASVIMIFTGQAWNMTFSFYHSLRAIPQDQQDAATVFRFSRWQKFRWVELPFATLGLVWNSMMSMAGGWFFLMITETYQLGDQDFRLPGIGSYMQVAVDQGRTDAMLWALLAMLLMIVALDQLLWRPVVVWAQKFRVEEGADTNGMSSRLLNWLRRSRLLNAGWQAVRRWRAGMSRPTESRRSLGRWDSSGPLRAALSFLPLVMLGGLLTLAGGKLLQLVAGVPPSDWLRMVGAAAITFTRVIASLVIGTAWALPAGLLIGLSPRWSRVFQPIVQIAASFPAPMLFPLVVSGLQALGVSLGWGAIVLMLLGTQWYILFNVIAGAMAVPADLREAGQSFRFGRWHRFRWIYAPAVFPYLVTGWVTAAGGAWNASIVAEYMHLPYRDETLVAFGLGSWISQATSRRDFSQLASSVVVMAVVVVVFNRTVWRRLYELAERRYSLSK